jgi:hypothetical protein
VALETASYVANLVASNPDGGDQRSTADDHIRLVKAAVLRTFPKMDGAVSLSAAQVMYLNDLSASVQLQLNQLRDGSATANNAINSRFANSASLALTANSASYAALASYAQSASYANFAGTAVQANTANSASYAALAGHATTATDADTADSALFANNAALANSAISASSAATLQNFAPAVTPEVNSVVVRNSAGYVFGTYFNQNSSIDSDSGDSINSFVVTRADAYFRRVSPSLAGQSLSAQNISGRTGTTKTLSSSAPSGGSNGDIWYQY